VKKSLEVVPVLLATWLIAYSLWAEPAGANHPQAFTGEIMDSLCAKDGTHEKMMDEMKSMGRDKQTCSQKCAQLGARYVLYDSAKKAIYGLDDQDKAASFAGRKVRVNGALERNKIKVATIEALDQ